jgi:gamma-glutamylcyclotransferase (GGCT)/AIG2-like uncharacterized protein YtfP
MRGLYFAYGSNLKWTRMRQRVPSARVMGRARLPGFRITCDKHGADGSGKANLYADAAAEVWGALYALDPADWPALDACETRYERIAVRVETGAERLLAETYVSEARTADPIPFLWYWRLVLEGAREHALPEAYVRILEMRPTREPTEAS